MYLACGVTDMRKGIAGLAALTQDVLRQKPASGAVRCLRFGGVRGIGSSFCSGMGKAFAFTTKFLSGADSCGRARRMGWRG